VNSFIFLRNDLGYLFFFGRITKEKGIKTSINLAKRLGLKLVIGGVALEADKVYFQKEVALLINGASVVFVEALNDYEKIFFYKNALALLMPVEREGPCPLAAIDAQACGTPIIAYRRGSLPELVKHYVSSYIVDLVWAVKHLKLINRRECRRWVENNFTAQKCA